MYTKGGQAVAMLNKAIWKTFQNNAMDYGDNYSCCQFIATAAACVFRRLLSAALYLTVSHWHVLMIAITVFTLPPISILFYHLLVT